MCDVVHRGVRREFLGFSRARGAVIEATILATRTRILPIDEILAEYRRLQVIVDKTAGPVEREAMAMLTEFVRSRGRGPRGRGLMSARSSSSKRRRGCTWASSTCAGIWAGCFGGLGAALESPSLRLEARSAPKLVGHG